MTTAEFSPSAAEAELLLTNRDAGLRMLRDLAARVGSRQSPREFLHGVMEVYKEIQRTEFPADMHQTFRNGPSHPLFVESLRQIRWENKRRLRILVLGCGDPFVGRDSTYAVQVVEESLAADQIEIVDRCEVTPSCWDDRVAHRFGTYDLVVSHSLVHFLAELVPFFQFIERVTAPGGYYVMGHEPSARFWKNADCLSALRDRQRDELRRRRWSRWPGLIGRILGKRQRKPTLHDAINAALRERFGFSSTLTAQEIDRLVDLHRPKEFPETFRIGSDGFDDDELRQQYLTGWQRQWMGSSGHVGYADARRLGAKWQTRDATLRRQFPLDGTSFTAVWQKANG